MGYSPDFNSENDTGDQPRKYRERRGARRYPNWEAVQSWRDRWDPEKVSAALEMLRRRASAEEIGEETGFGTLEVKDNEGATRLVPDLRGLDVIHVPLRDRSVGRTKSDQDLDLSYARLEGSRLTGLDLSYANLTRARLQKSTLRRTNLTGADLTKAHLEDADMRNAVLDGASLGHIRYTEDGYWWRGTVLMEAHLENAHYVDPVLDRCAKDQYYLNVLKYRNRNSLVFRLFFCLWWATCNYGKSLSIWAMLSVGLAIVFASVYYYYLGESAFCISVLDWSFSTMVYYSVITFTTLGFGDVTPKTQPAAWWVMAEVILGYVMLGGLISIFATKLARRS